jgi:hypothetical protein
LTRRWARCTPAPAGWAARSGYGLLSIAGLSIGLLSYGLLIGLVAGFLTDAIVTAGGA